MNKKGFVFSFATAMFFVALFAGVIFTIALVSSEKIRLYAIGAVLLVGLLYLIGQAMNSSSGFTKDKLMVIALFIIIGVIFIFGSGYIRQTIYTGTFVKPIWARLECAPSGSLSGSSTFYSTTGQEITCGITENTEECRLTLKNKCTVTSCFGSLGTAKITVAGVTYILQPGDTKIINMRAGNSYAINHPAGGYASKVQITKEWDPWKLYRFVSGGKWVVNSENCAIRSNSFSNILEEDYPGSQLYKTGEEGSRWINYVDDWVYGPATNVFTHPTYGQVYCTAGQIFDIIEVEVKDGSIKKVDPSYSATLPNGERLNGLGSKLENVECCPNEPNCGDDFKYKPTTPDCVSDIQCLNAGGPIPVTGTTYITYKCENSNCAQKGPFTVECTSNAQCSDGQICDLSTMNYGKCITQSSNDYCGDGRCSVTESAVSCPADCAAFDTCNKWYQEKGVLTSYKYNFLGFKFGATQEPVCKTADWVWLLSIVVIVVVIGTLVIIVNRPKRDIKPVKTKK